MGIKTPWEVVDIYFQEDCRVPQIKTKECQIKLVEVLWARPGSGFTLLFEACVMMLIESEMPINKVGNVINENPHRVWTTFNSWLTKAYAADQPNIPSKLGLDETSRRKGYNYITVAVDIDKRRVIHVTEGKDKEAVKKVKNYLEAKGIDVMKVKHASMDRSPSFSFLEFPNSGPVT